MWLFRRITPKPEDPEKSAYIRSLIIVWSITIVWLFSLYLVIFIWKPAGLWNIFVSIILIPFCPTPSDLFYSFEKYKENIKELKEPKEKAPEWLEEMRKR